MIKKALSMWKDEDIRNYILYALKHPYLACNMYPHKRVQPEFLNQCHQAIQKQVTYPFHVMDLVRFLNKRVRLEEKEKFLNMSLGIPMFISLASCELKISRKIDIDFWEQSFADDEDMAALHRFIYMYQILIEECSLEDKTRYFYSLEEIILSWCKAYSERKKEELHSEIFHSYTVAERLTNWTLCLALTAPEGYYNKQIFSSILEQAEFLISNLEYYGDYFTGNHFFNNGKALYIVGQLLGAKKYALAGKKIMIDSFSKLIHEHGVLREGSSHYQFLFYKWLMDLEDVAEQSGDIDFLITLRNWLSKMERGLSFFSMREGEKYTIPCFGDTSPDYPPEKLLKMITLKGEDNNTVETLSGDYVKMQKNNFIVFGKVNHDMYPNNLTGHFHHDTGSVVAYYKNHCFLSDCGRVHYITDEEGNKGKDVGSHTILSIEDYNPEINLRSFYCKSFIKRMASKKPYITTDNTYPSFTLHSVGEARIKGIKEKERTCYLEEDSFVIIDSIQGEGKKKIKLYFHTPWNIREEDDNLILEKDGNLLSMQINLDNGERKIYREGSFSSQVVSYGKTEAINTILYEAVVDLPTTIKIIFTNI
jgi:hypothetical protein magn03010485